MPNPNRPPQKGPRQPRKPGPSSSKPSTTSNTVADSFVHDDIECRIFRALSDKAFFAKVFADSAGVIRYVNPCFAEMLGYRPEELVGQSISIAHTPEQMKNSQRIIEASVENGHSEPQENWYLRRDGTEFPLLVGCVSIKSPVTGETLTAMSGVDISPIMQAQKDYQTLFDEMLDGFAHHEIICDDSGAPVDYRYLAVNSAWERMVGQKAEDVIGRTVLEILPGVEQYWIDTFGAVALTGKPNRFDDYVAVLDKHFEVTAFCPAPGEFACIFEDITDRLKAEKAYQTLFNEMLDSFSHFEVIFDDAGKAVDYRYLAVNPAWEKAREQRAEDVVGKTLKEISPDHDPAWIEMAGEVALTGEPIRTRIYYKGLDKHFEATVFRPAPGECAVILQDVTEQMKAEEKSELLSAQLSRAQRLESVGRFSGNVAHDYNNMLTVILGYVERNLLRVERDDPIYADLVEIGQVAERSAALTHQLLAFASNQPASPRVIDLNETVEGTLVLIRRLIGESINLTWSPGENLSPVRIDPIQIDQILTNLCVNSRDAIVDVGDIIIATKNVSFDEEFCAWHPDCRMGDYVELAVTDNGSGMDPDTQAHLFEPFFTTKAQGQGTGLGLSTLYGIVQQYDGFVTVTSELGVGTTFRVNLPQQTAELDPSPKQTVPEKNETGRETILLVEDEPAILRLTMTILEGRGYFVLTASTPSEAVRLAQNHSGPIDLLLTDVVMPEMNGSVLAERIQALHPDIKYLFMSGFTSNILAPHGVLEDGVHFIAKPFHLKDLVAKVRETLDS